MAQGQEQQDQQQGQQIIQFVVEALKSGKQPEEIVGVLVEKGVDQAQATEIVQQVAAKLGGSQQPQGSQNGPQDGSGPNGQQESGGKQGITAEQALEVLSRLGISGEKILEVVKVILNINRGELKRLLSALQRDGQQEQQEQPQQGGGNY